jgi:superfamily II DNA helicase RecQ
MNKGPLHWTSKLYSKKRVLSALADIINTQRAVDILIKWTLQRAQKYSVREYRISHPARYVCHVCDVCFGSRHELNTHALECQVMEDISKVNEQSEMLALDDIFNKDEGRKLQAKRLMYSTELGSLEWRVDATILDPLRPHIADTIDVINKNRSTALTIHSNDPKSVFTKVKPIHNAAMVTQARVRVDMPEKDYFEDVLFQIQQDIQDSVDIVICPQASTQADVHFIWKGYALNSIQIIGNIVSSCTRTLSR